MILKKLRNKTYSIWRSIVFSFHKFFLTSDFIEDSLKLVSLELAIDIVSGDQISGDYFEFGVYKGDSFAKVYNRFRRKDDPSIFQKRRFFAFDSFEGLPSSKDEFLPNQYRQGAYRSEHNIFLKNIKRKSVDIESVVVVKGFFEDSLTNALRKKEKLSKVALVYFDSDLYESTKQALNFIIPHLQTGTLLVFDDWFRHRNTKKHGVQRACSEWLDENRKIELNMVHFHRRVVFSVDFNENDK